MKEIEKSWALLLVHVQKMVSSIRYRMWFEPITFQSDDGQTLTVGQSWSV